MNTITVCILAFATLCALSFSTEACRCLPFDNVNRISSSLNCFEGALVRFVVVNSRSTKLNKKPAFVYKTVLQEVYYDSTVSNLAQRIGQTNFTAAVQQTGSSCDFQLSVGSTYIAKVKPSGKFFLVPSQCEKTNVDLTSEWATLSETLKKTEFSCNPCLNNPCEEGQTCTPQQVNCIRAPCWPTASCSA